MCGRASGIGRDEKRASGGEVSHLESWLPLRFAPRSSGQSVAAFFYKDLILYLITSYSQLYLKTRINHEEHEGHEENKKNAFSGEAAFVLFVSFVV